MSKPKFNWLGQGHAEDAILFHRFRYYVLDHPVISDVDYDAMERDALTHFPNSTILNSVGSSIRRDYPPYIQEGRWPHKDERIDRDLEYILA
jgi:hypothetical protein